MLYNKWKVSDKKKKLNVTKSDGNILEKCNRKITSEIFSIDITLVKSSTSAKLHLTTSGIAFTLYTYI